MERQISPNCLALSKAIIKVQHSIMTSDQVVQEDIPGEQEVLESQAPTIPAMPPALPPRDDKPNIKPIYGLDTSLSTTLIFRQSEFYGMPRMSPQTAIYTTNTIDLEQVVAAQEDNDEFWLNVIGCYNDAFVRRNNLPGLEQRIVDGIPESLRGAIYLKVLQVRAGAEQNTYRNLAKTVEGIKTEEFEMDLKDLLKDTLILLRIFEHCLKEVSPIPLQDTRRKTYEFVATAADLLKKFTNLADCDILALLFRLCELHSSLSKDAFTYKGLRALEDKAKDQFLHMIAQGVDLEKFYKNLVLVGINYPADDTVRMIMLDLIVFEGFDSLIRIMVAQMLLKKSKIMELNGDDLVRYIMTDDFSTSIDKETIIKLTEVEFPLIVYENEYYIKIANPISSNDQELLNLKEVYEDLVNKKAEIVDKLESLRKTHQEIQSQNEDYEKKLSNAQSERESFQKEHSELQDQYSRLTMQENLNNTVKANEDISRSNMELEQQIQELEAAVEKKKTKLAKHAR